MLLAIYAAIIDTFMKKANEKADVVMRALASRLGIVLHDSHHRINLKNGCVFSTSSLLQLFYLSKFLWFSKIIEKHGIS